MRRRPVAVLFGLLVVFALGACDDTGPQDNPEPTATTSVAATDGHVAADLEALLPDQIGQTSLSKASTVGEAVFRDDAWSQEMTDFLDGAGKARGDLLYAQVWDPGSGLDLDAGAFQVPGIDAAALRQALVDSARPNAPGLTSQTEKLADKSVTAVVYPGGGPTLYLYEHDDVVFYVGTPDVGLAAEFMTGLP